MAGEEAIYEADVVGDEEAEGEADEACSYAQMTAHRGKPLFPVSKR